MPDVRFLLINPTSPLWRARAAGRPRGARPFRFSMLTSLYVAAAMPAGVRTRIVDEDVEPVDLGTDADLVGLSCMTHNAPRAYEIADELRRRGRTVVLGGYHPTFLPDEAAAHADAVCVGEAEGTAPRMMADFLAGRLRPRYVSEPVDLRGLPVPDRRLLRSSAYVTPDAVQATRGCPHACSFCSVSAFARRRFRKRPVGEVVDELRQLGRWLIFMDDNIALDHDYARELFARMAPLGKRWCSQCGVGIADDPGLVSLAARSGCMGLFVGFESLSDANLAAWRKTPNRHRDYARAVARLHAAGIGVYSGFVFGMDGDRPDVFARTLDFLEEARVDALQATILTPFPGTPLFAEMERQGRITTRDWSLYDFGHLVFEPRGLSPERLRAGHAWIQSRFYSRASTWRRIARAFGYLSPAVVLHAMAPLNLGYRARHRAYGTFQASARDGFDEAWPRGDSGASDAEEALAENRAWRLQGRSERRARAPGEDERARGGGRKNGRTTRPPLRFSTGTERRGRSVTPAPPAAICASVERLVARKSSPAPAREGKARAWSRKQCPSSKSSTGTRRARRPRPARPNGRAATSRGPCARWRACP